MIIGGKEVVTTRMIVMGKCGDSHAGKKTLKGRADKIRVPNFWEPNANGTCDRGWYHSNTK